MFPELCPLLRPLSETCKPPEKGQQCYQGRLLKILILRFRLPFNRKLFRVKQKNKSLFRVTGIACTAWLTSARGAGPSRRRRRGRRSTRRHGRGRPSTRPPTRPPGQCWDVEELGQFWDVEEFGHLTHQSTFAPKAARRSVSAGVMPRSQPPSAPASMQRSALADKSLSPSSPPHRAPSTHPPPASCLQA